MVKMPNVIKRVIIFLREPIIANDNQLVQVFLASVVETHANAIVFSLIGAADNALIVPIDSMKSCLIRDIVLPDDVQIETIDPVMFLKELETEDKRRAEAAENDNTDSIEHLAVAHMVAHSSGKA